MNEVKKGQIWKGATSRYKVVNVILNPPYEKEATLIDLSNDSQYTWQCWVIDELLELDEETETPLKAGKINDTGIFYTSKESGNTKEEDFSLTEALKYQYVPNFEQTEIESSIKMRDLLTEPKNKYCRRHTQKIQTL